LEEVERSGYGVVRIDGGIYPIAEALAKKLDKNKVHTIEVQVGRFLSGFKIELERSLSKTERAALKKRNKKIEKIAEDEKIELIEKVRKGLHIGGGQITVMYKALGTRQKALVKEFEENYSELFS